MTQLTKISVPSALFNGDQTRFIAEQRLATGQQDGQGKHQTILSANRLIDMNGVDFRGQPLLAAAAMTPGTYATLTTLQPLPPISTVTPLVNQL